MAEKAREKGRHVFLIGRRFDPLKEWPGIPGIRNAISVQTPRFLFSSGRKHSSSVQFVCIGYTHDNFPLKLSRRPPGIRLACQVNSQTVKHNLVPSSGPESIDEPGVIQRICNLHVEFAVRPPIVGGVRNELEAGICDVLHDSITFGACR